MQIQTSTDYGKFSVMEFNRDVKKTKKLEASMKAHGWIPAYPAHVCPEKNKLKIKAGHHRFTVAQKLGIPVVYVVCSDNASIHELESTTVKWSLEDYLVSYVRLGDPDYDVVQQFYQKSGLNLNACISLLGGEVVGSNNKMKQFIAGEYSVKDTFAAETVLSVVNAMRRSDIKWASHQLCVQAISRIVVAGHADIKLLIHKIETNPEMIRKQVSLEAFTAHFEEIYNRKSSKRIPIAWLTNETMKQRSMSFGKTK